MRGMQAVILAAGRGSRMNDLTEELPKPLLEVNGKTLLEYKLDMLPAQVDEVVFIVGYLGGKIQQRYGGEYKGKRILYIEQDVLDGTAGALWRAKDILHDKFLVLMGDDLYSREDAERCLAVDGWALLVQELEHMGSGGMVVTAADGSIDAIQEGDHRGVAGRVSTSMFSLDTRIFDHAMVPKSEGSNEYGLPQTVLAASKESNIPFKAIPATFWIQITSPEDLQKAEKELNAAALT